MLHNYCPLFSPPAAATAVAVARVQQYIFPTLKAGGGIAAARKNVLQSRGPGLLYVANHTEGLSDALRQRVGCCGRYVQATVGQPKRKISLLTGGNHVVELNS